MVGRFFFILQLIAEELGSGGRMMKVRPRESYLGPVFRADAKAEGQDVVVGGWECIGGCHPRFARWFSVTLTRASAPWAFSRGEPFRNIAAIELFASLLSVMVFGEAWRKGARGVMHLTGLTDNSGNTAALCRLMSSKFPLVVILTEFVAQMRRLNVELDLQWIPRNQNEEADGLTNGRFEPFDVRRRIHVELKELHFIVLGQMLKVADHLYQEVHERRRREKDESVNQSGPAAADVREQRSKRRRAQPLKEREPW